MDKATRRELSQYLALGQSAFYVLTGIWPIFSIGTFQKVTGPKTDLWLVKTAGTLITVIGSVIGLAGYRRRVSPEIGLLAVGCAAGLAAIDVVYVAKKRISPIYLLDAIAEGGLIALWALVWPTEKEGKEGR
ncbi:MAG: hypothetical protein ABIO92_04615 [Chloroflexia bacterium]